MGYEFGGFRLDAAQRRLFAPDGAAVELPSRAFDVLLFMVERPGQLLDKAAILKAVWPDTVVEEGNLSQCVFALRRALGDTTTEHRFISTMPGRGYQFVAQVHPAGGSTASATPVQEEPVSPVPDRKSPDTANSSPRTLRHVAIAATVLVALLCGYLFWRSPPTQTSIAEPAAATAAIAHATIAVLPFADLSPAKDMEYFADGIAEELMSSLAKVGNLRVIGRRSTFAFKGRNDDAQAIGEKLRVETILEGSVRKESGRIRISAQLTRTRDGVSLWAESYDRKLDDVLDIQGSIASEVVAALGPVVHRPPSSRVPGAYDANLTRNAEAYSAYLRGRYLAARQSDSDLPRARDEFLRAVELDPQFAMAHAWLARTYSVLARRALADIPKYRSLASAALDRALKLEPAIGDIWWVRSQFIEGDNAPLALRASGLEHAFAASPDDAELMLRLGFTYLLLGRRSEARQLVERAYAADRLWPPAIATLASVSYGNDGNRQRALLLIDELESIAPADLRVPRLRSLIAFNEGRALDWDRWQARAVEVAPRDQPVHGYLALQYAQLGLLDAALHHAQASGDVNPDSAGGWFNIAHVHLFAGNLVAARPVVQEAMARRPADFLAQLAQAELQYFTNDCAGAVQSILLARPAYNQPAGALDLLGDPDHVAILVWCLRRQGNLARVAEMGRVFDLQYAPPVFPGLYDGWRARMAAARGDRGALVTHLTALAKTRSMAFAFSVHEPMIQPYLHDPEVKALLDTLDARRAEWRRIIPKSSMRVPIPDAPRNSGS